MEPLQVAVGLLIGLGAGFVLGRYLYQRLLLQEEAAARAKREEILASAKADAERTRKEAEVRARDEVVTRREEFDREAEKSRAEFRDQEKRLGKREEQLERRDEEVTARDRHLVDQEKRLAHRQASLTQRDKDLDEKEQQIGTRLLEVANLSREEAESRVLGRVEQEMAAETDKLIARRVEEAKEEADQRARMIVLTAIQRLGTTHMSEATVSTVDVPNDEMKGRIIGREGRNIRAFEKATGVDVIVDDTPGVIVVSAFDGVRREIARRTMVQLIQDGRVHPARIDEVTATVRRDMEAGLKETGKKALAEVGLHGLHGKLIDLLGRLRFRTSYGQNVLDHLIEATHIGAALAAEMKLDVKLAKRCVLLHDIGKAIDHEVEGGHPAIGADLARRCGENKIVVNAIAAHHDDVPMESPYAVLTQVSDALSAGRPGARRETFDRYIERLQRLEDVASAFPGVEQAFAIQAGREVRVIVNNAKVSDKMAMKIARDIALEIERELTYPGEVRVTLVRETRVVEYAR
ncbi:MAG: ribonuclease Y [Planctomycetes bacterium]|nr:ribonuclease Y [Planctomycetota bacterium]